MLRAMARLFRALTEPTSLVLLLAPSGRLVNAAFATATVVNAALTAGA
jgi:hypothetical protein